jgi:hypothetical protein
MRMMEGRWKSESPTSVDFDSAYIALAFMWDDCGSVGKWEILLDKNFSWIVKCPGNDEYKKTTDSEPLLFKGKNSLLDYVLSKELLRNFTNNPFRDSGYLRRLSELNLVIYTGPIRNTRSARDLSDYSYTYSVSGFLEYFLGQEVHDLISCNVDDVLRLKIENNFKPSWFR